MLNVTLNPGSNYQMVNDPSVYVEFPLVATPDVAFIAWTTTPWTLPSNLALAVNPDFDYIKIKDKKRNKVRVLLHADAYFSPC